MHPRSIDMGPNASRVAQALNLTEPVSAVITVGGTNGKGSVAAHLEALIGAHGARVGLFTSPHLLRYNERIRVDGAEVADATLIEAFERIEAARGTTTLTFFEYNTLAALLIFAARALDVAVLEVGLGGRLDATNLLAADVAVLASVGFDHRDYLGDTLELIGAEKAGIFRDRAAVLGTSAMPAASTPRSPRRGARGDRRADFRWQARGRLGLRGAHRRASGCRPRRWPATSSSAMPPPRSRRSSPWGRASRPRRRSRARGVRSRR